MSKKETIKNIKRMNPDVNENALNELSELNNDFDVKIRAQKAFTDATQEKVKNHQALNDSEIALLCPVALKNTMTNAEIEKLGLSKHYSFEAVQKLVKEFEETMSEVLTKITAMKKVELTKAQQIEFAKQAALLRFTAKSYNEDNIADVVDIDDLLNVDRKEDAGNGLYEVFNRVQESIVQGKYLYSSNGKVKDADTKTRKARPIKNFKQSINVNQKLSELAFALV